MASISGTLDAADEIVGPLTMPAGTPGEFNKVNVSLVGDLVGSVELQRSFDGGAVWDKAATYTAAVGTTVDAIERGMQIRLKAITRSGGSFVARLGFGEANA